MSKSEPLSGSLYLTYGYDGRIYHVSRIGRGTSGFLQYMRNEMYEVLIKGRIPNYWMGHYEFPDQKHIPPIRPDRLNGYLDAVSQASEEHHGQSMHTVNMRDAFFCHLKKIIPLTPASETAALAAHPDYPKPTDGVGAHVPLSNAFLPEYEAYYGLQTENGLLIFSHSIEGQRQRRMFEEYLENRFFDPEVPEKLKYFEIIGEPAQMRLLADRLTQSQVDGMSDFTPSYVKADILAQGRCVKEYDLMKSIVNLRRYQLRDQTQDSTPRERLRELFATYFPHPMKSQRPECLQSSQYPDEGRIITFKMSR